MPPSSSLSQNKDAAAIAETVRACRKWGMISGMAMMLLCCFWGLPPVGELSQNYKAYTGTHHQWAHGGEFMVACSFCFPYVKFQNVLSYKLLFVSILLAMFCNGAAYAVAALLGDFWVGTAMNTDGPGGTPGPERELTHWSILSLMLVPVITGITCFIAFPMFLYGLVQNTEGKSLLAEIEMNSEEDTKKTK